ncbi:flagellin N-terminal helical domain-containing protein [Vallitalea okinawensis]|uniref:flagellin N-terminal helical domain-containing protein n=1 Tax=Vallitalea okinawensis TaxID=2078660 RepID=UPI000CFC61ED|nr:flagellin [Vallitalea okinawensis]
MVINHNMLAINTTNALGRTTGAQSKSMEKLSSGLRINRAGDDAAGLAISEKMRGQIRGLEQASRNAQDGISMVQTAEGALNETQSILQRMRELAVQSSSDTLVQTDRDKIQAEVDQLATEITRISNTTEFNTQNLLNGGLDSTTTNGSDVTFHIGANEGQQLTFGISAMDAESLGVASDSTTGTVSGATDVTDATVSGSAAAVTDGNTVTVSTVAVAATAGDVVGATTYANIAALNTALGDCSTTNKTIEISVDGGATQTITFDADYSGGGAFADWTAFETFVDGQLTGATVTGADGAGFTFTSSSTGASSSVSITSDPDSITGAGTETAGTDTSYTVTLSDGASTDSVITGLAGTETSISGTGDFAGFTLTTDGAFDENLAATITVGVATSSAASIASDGTVTDAVVASGIDVSSRTAADAAITTINDAIDTVSEERSKLGALQNRLDHTINNLDTSAENLQSAESRIRDVDMAEEMVELTKTNILQQAAQSMLAQANQNPQGVLSLLR